MMNCEEVPNPPKEKEAERRAEVSAGFFSSFLISQGNNRKLKAQEVGLRDKLELLKLFKLS